MIETICVERLANCADAPVHHVARRHHVRAGRSMRERRFYQKFHSLVVENMEVIAVNARDAAVAVAHVFAQADIGDGDQLRTF